MFCVDDLWDGFHEIVIDVYELFLFRCAYMLVFRLRIRNAYNMRIAGLYDIFSQLR